MGKKVKIDREKTAQNIKKLYSEGYFHTEIQQKLNISQAVFYQICKEYDINSPRRLEIQPDENMLNQIKELLNNGVGYRGVAKKLNITCRIIERICKDNGFESKIKQKAPIPPITDKKTIELVKKLFNEGYGTEGIAKKINSTKRTIARVLKNENVEIKRLRPRKPGALSIKEKECNYCNKIKELIFFRKRVKSGYDYYESNCKKCEAVIHKIWLQTPVGKAFIERNKIKTNENSRKRYASDPYFKLRDRVSAEINRGLKRNNSSKGGNSIIDYLPYSIDELKEYIEKKFKEPGNEWMNWENWGIYNSKTWDANDSSTWSWHLDHIKPQSDFYYITMNDPEFQECWALSNLRPYSAKQNIIDGATKIRHNKT